MNKKQEDREQKKLAAMACQGSASALRSAGQVSKTYEHRGVKAVRVERVLARAKAAQEARHKARAAKAEAFDWIEKESAEVQPFYNGWRARAGNALGESEGPRATLLDAVTKARAALTASIEKHGGTLVILLALVFSACAPAAKLCRRSDLTNTQKIDCLRRDVRLIRLMGL